MNTTNVINKIWSVVLIETLRGRESPCHGRNCLDNLLAFYQYARERFNWNNEASSIKIEMDYSSSTRL